MLVYPDVVQDFRGTWKALPSDTSATSYIVNGYRLRHVLFGFVAHGMSLLSCATVVVLEMHGYIGRVTHDMYLQVIYGPTGVALRGTGFCPYAAHQLLARPEECEYAFSRQGDEILAEVSFRSSFGQPVTRMMTASRVEVVDA